MEPRADSYSDWKKWEAGQFGRCHRSDARYFTWCIAQADLLASPIRVLEIGYGNGNFLGFCRSQGWHAVGIESNESLRDRARASDFQVHPDIEALPEGEPFDLIAAFDVMEHMPAQQAELLLASMKARLSTQGAIIVRVPNGDSPFGRIYQHGDRTHVETYGSEKLRQLCLPLGLGISQPGDAPWFAQQGHGRTPRSFLRAGLRRLFGWLIGFAYFGCRLDLSPNLLVVMKPI